MPNTKIIASIAIFSLLLFCTSIVKNKTRIIEKNISAYEKKISILQKDLYETQLDYHYLSSPKLLQEKIHFLTNDQYQHMNFSKIYLSYKDFILEQKKLSQK